MLLSLVAPKGAGGYIKYRPQGPWTMGPGPRGLGPNKNKDVPRLAL